jgi:hypothetical protein
MCASSSAAPREAPTMAGAAEIMERLRQQKVNGDGK